jgi:predicted metal-dependent phosphoesterase TrpH
VREGRSRKLYCRTIRAERAGRSSAARVRTATPAEARITLLTRTALSPTTAHRNRAPAAAAIATLVVLLTWLVAIPAVRDMVTRDAAPGARLLHSTAYLVLSPVYDVMDALTLLSVSQLVAVVLSLGVVLLAWRAWRWRASGVRPRVWRELRLALLSLGAFLAFVAAAVLVPRPMAALALEDRDAVKVDVHSHTNASHDGRGDFGASDNIDWHRDAGFDVAYITDHKSFDGASEAMRLNPRRAGDGLVMLSGLEFIDNHNHINALGATAADSAWIRVEARRQRLGWPARERGSAVFIQTIPENLERIPLPDRSSGRGLAGIELSDGAPRGIEQSQRDRALILRIADSLDLAVVAGSNNHGWGRTAVAWSVLSIPGWRDMAPEELGRAIEDRIRTERRSAVTIVERRSPDPAGSRVALAATLPAVTWNLLVTLSGAQRISWIIWSWILAAAALLYTARRESKRVVHDTPVAPPAKREDAAIV